MKKYYYDRSIFAFSPFGGYYKPEKKIKKFYYPIQYLHAPTKA